MMEIRCKHCGTRNRIPFRFAHRKGKCGSCKEPLGAPQAPIAIDSVADFKSLMDDSKLPVLVDFWADWCAPCRQLAPELEDLARMCQGKLLVAKVDTERLKPVAEKYQIRAIPALLYFREGKLEKRHEGGMKAAKIKALFGL